MKKYKFTRNLGLKIMALAFASVLWLIVVNIDDPVEISTFRNVPVTIQNAEIIMNKGKTYKVVDDTQSVSVIVKAKRSILSKISASDIVATADMSEMQIESLVPITATVRGYEGEYTAETTPANLRVVIDDQMKKVFPLTVSTTGTPRDGYVIDYSKMTTNPEKITVKGSKSLVSSIDKAVAKVDVSGISKSGEVSAELVYYDSKGNPINRSQLSDNVGEDGVTVNVTVLNTKDIALKFGVTGDPAAGYAYSSITSEPEKIQVCGTKEDLADLTELDIPASEIDISGATEKIEKTIDILPYLPQGIQLVDKTANNVVVTVSIEQEGARTIEFPLESIQIKNLQDDLKVTFASDADIELKFKGPQEALDALNINDATSIDMKGNTKPGTYEVPVDVDLGEASGVTLTKKPVIKVNVTKKDESQNASDTKGE